MAGIGRVNGDLFGDEQARCAVLSYDYTVLAGTQGQMNHRKKDRLFELVERLQLPVVLFAEGGGGRPGDTDTAVVTGLDTEAFALFGALSGLVPLVGIVSGRCFAGNAALLGCCHVIIATPGRQHRYGWAGHDRGRWARGVPPRGGRADLGAGAERGRRHPLRRREGSRRGGPALPVLLPRRRARSGPRRTSTSCATSSRPTAGASTTCSRAIELLADEGSVLELRPSFAPGMVTALVRLEGRPVGVIANNPMHLAGAIDAANADKAARFLQLCDAFELPIVSLCDTPGFMVGPEAERRRWSATSAACSWSEPR